MRQKENLIPFLPRGPTVKFVETDAGLVKTMSIPVGEAGSNSRLGRPRPAFSPLVFLLITDDTKDRDRRK